MSLQTVGRYEIIGELGRGAMGVVYKAKDPTIGRTVALKTMRLDVHGLDAGEMVSRFQNEARAAGLLNHPNIVTIYDAGERDGIFYIAMECVEGTSLHELLAEKHILAPEEAVRISRDICKGLDYAHSHGIIHRDIKPANIMITPKGVVKLMDFGIAKAGGNMTNTGQVLGTPNYMSPEQVKGRPLDGRSDFFSFGVVLYEMLTGEKPFVGQNVTTIIYKIVNESPIAPRELDVTIHPGLSAIVVRTLAKSPDDRYQSGAELIRDLENYKAAGTTLNATTVLSSQTTALPSHEKTVVLPMRVVSGSTVRIAEAPAPAKSPVPLRQPAVVAHPKHRTGLIILMVAVLLLSVGIGGYAYYTHNRMQELEMEIKANEAQPPRQQQEEPRAPAKPLDTEIAPDTTVKLTAENKSEESPSTGKKSATTPSQVAAQRSELTFTSQPSGATVQVDGEREPKWVTPFKAPRLAAGTHTIVFSKDGYLPQTLAVEAISGKSVAVSAELTLASKMAVSSNPPGANVWIDGKDSGFVTPTQLTLDKGQHRITIRKAGYKEASTEANLAEGQTLSFSPILLSLGQRTEDGRSSNLFSRLLGTDAIPEGKGLVHIRTVPEGATVIIDGHVAPKKTNLKWPTVPGVYSIDLQMAGYKSIHRNIQVEQGKIKNLDEFLEKQ